MSHAAFTVYSKSATARILARLLGQPVEAKDIAQVQEWVSVIWIKCVKGSPRFISKAAYQHDFLTLRQEGAKLVKVSPLGLFSWNALNLDSGHEYRVWVEPGKGHVCECPDYHKQMETQGKAICKHKLAVLNFLDRLAVA